MGIVKIGYGDQVVNYGDTTGEVFQRRIGRVYMVDADNEAIIIRQFDTEQASDCGQNYVDSAHRKPRSSKPRGTGTSLSRLTTLKDIWVVG